MQFLLFTQHDQATTIFSPTLNERIWTLNSEYWTVQTFFLEDLSRLSLPRWLLLRWLPGRSLLSARRLGGGDLPPSDPTPLSDLSFLRSTTSSWVSGKHLSVRASSLAPESVMSFWASVRLSNVLFILSAYGMISYFSTSTHTQTIRTVLL